MNKTLIVAALAGIFIASVANAQDQLPGSQKTKCYGLRKIKDECKSGGGDEQRCSGESKYIKDPNEWKLAYPATCAKQGGSLLSPAELLSSTEK
ncbi:MAG: DUF2282 domain-containing protein [Rickettsiales bacterium]